MVVCGYCGYRLAACSVDNYRRYRCNGRYNLQRHLPLSERCPATAYSADKVEDLIWNEILRQVSNPEVITQTLRDQAAAGEKDRARADANVASLQKGLSVAQHRIDELVDLYTSGGLDRPTYDRKMAQYVRSKQEAEKALTDTRSRASKQQEALASLQLIEQLCDRIRAGLPLLTYADKRDFLQAVDLRVIMLKESLEITGVLHESSIATKASVTGGEVLYSTQRLP
jgi:hypothetical protein